MMLEAFAAAAIESSDCLNWEVWVDYDHSAVVALYIPDSQADKVEYIETNSIVIAIDWYDLPGPQTRLALYIHPDYAGLPFDGLLAVMECWQTTRMNVQDVAVAWGTIPNVWWNVIWYQGSCFGWFPSQQAEEAYFPYTGPGWLPWNRNGGWYPDYRWSAPSHPTGVDG